MKKIVLVSALMLISVPASAQTQPQTQPVQQQVVVPRVCRPYTDILKIGDEKHITHGTACLQPDGLTWTLQPAEVKVAPPTICCPEYHHHDH